MLRHYSLVGCDVVHVCRRADQSFVWKWHLNFRAVGITTKCVFKNGKIEPNITNITKSHLYITEICAVHFSKYKCAQFKFTYWRQIFVLMRKFQFANPSTNSVISWTSRLITCHKILKQSELMQLWGHDRQHISSTARISTKFDIAVLFVKYWSAINHINPYIQWLVCMSLRVPFFLFSNLGSGYFGTGELWVANNLGFQFSGNYTGGWYVIRVLWVVT